MKIPFSVSLLTAFLILVLLCFLQRQNDIASSGDSRMGYVAFNHADTAKAAEIMQFWKHADYPKRAVAIKRMVKFDYALMFVYCLYLSIFLFYFWRKEKRSLAKIVWGVGFLSIITGTLLDAIQAWKIYHYVAADAPLEDLRSVAAIKWIILYIGIAAFLLSILPRDLVSKAFLKRALRYLSQFLKSLWLFFPGILFLLLPVFCFWSLGQGKDILADFTNITDKTGIKRFIQFDYTRIIFFIGIAFWAYVSWYSSRIISYIKKNRQQLDMESAHTVSREQSESAYNRHDPFFEIGKSFLDEFPRAIGNCCFLVLELAVLQSSIIAAPISGLAAWLFFLWGIIVLVYINRWIHSTQAIKPAFRKIFWIILYAFLAFVIIISITGMNIWVLFALLLWLHIIFNYYINLRRLMLEEVTFKVIRTGKERTLLERTMDYFCIPRKETGFYRWLLIVCANGILLYFLGIFWLAFSRWLGPFPFIIMAFAVLLAYGNIVTAFSVKYKVNFHFLLLVLALVIGSKETHRVHTVKLETGNNGYHNKPALKEYLKSWLDKRLDSGNARYDMYFIMANGGASRSGYWTAATLGKIEDGSLKDNLPGRFSDHIFCLSGTSGGGVGVAAFFSLLRDKQIKSDSLFKKSTQHFLEQDYFTYTVARMLGPDFFKYIFRFSGIDDRARALEFAFEKSARNTTDGLYQVPFHENFSSFPAMIGNKINLPILFINTTRMQDGNPGVVTNLFLDSSIFNNRLDVIKLVDSNRDISMASASILGARFPYLSPAGRIADNYFVDGGYFDNSGAGAIQELIRGILKIAQEDPVIKEKLKRIDFHVLHIINSPPPGFESANIKAVAPVKNDLLSPILTIVGAYDMQTTVNDRRLIKYVNDINSEKVHAADYRYISLYLETKEWKDDKKYDHIGLEPGYAMNWFMSDTTLRRINDRLETNPAIKRLADTIKW